MILLRCKKFDKKTAVITNESFIGAELYPDSIERCTGLFDDSNNLVYENDRLDIIAADNGEKLYSGKVVYSPQKTQFMLAGDNGENVSELSLGLLIGTNLAYVIKDKNE